MIHLMKINSLCYDDDDPNESNEIQPKSDYLRFPWFIKNTKVQDTFWNLNWPKSPQENELEFQFIVNFFARFPSNLYERFAVKLHTLFSDQQVDQSQRRDSPWQNKDPGRKNCPE